MDAVSKGCKILFNFWIAITTKIVVQRGGHNDFDQVLGTPIYSDSCRWSRPWTLRILRFHFVLPEGLEHDFRNVVQSAPLAPWERPRCCYWSMPRALGWSYKASKLCFQEARDLQMEISPEVSHAFWDSLQTCGRSGSEGKIPQPHGTLVPARWRFHRKN